MYTTTVPIIVDTPFEKEALLKDLRRCKVNRIALALNREIELTFTSPANLARLKELLEYFKEQGFVDLQHIAIDWGVEEKSLRKLSAIVLGERVSKAQRLSNWEAEQLTPQQQEYAATDAWVCTRILEHLEWSEPKSEPVTIIACRGQQEMLKEQIKRRARHRRHTRKPEQNK